MNGTSSTRATVGTTVQVKDLFANYPVRQSSSRSNHQSELKELHKISLGMGLTYAMSLTLRINKTMYMSLRKYVLQVSQGIIHSSVDPLLND